jgi:predicted Zn-dependent protease
LWLRTLENLRQNREEDALTLLTHNMNETPYNPELKKALISLLEVRLHDKAPDEALLTVMKLPEGYPEEATSFLKSSDALYALFLAEGWNEAALSLYPKGGHAEQEPSWIAEAHAEALRKNRGLKEAIAYLSLQEETPALMALKGNFLLQNHQIKEGIETLNNLAEKQGPESEQAAVLLAQIAFKNGAWSEAKKALAKNSAAERSTQGQTLLARIALEMKDEEEAKRIYEGIEGDSFEAKSFLAKKAFDAGDWRRAYELTEKLILLDPENQVLRENLEMLLQVQMDNAG